mmetsp:Transcript_55057/g.99149  ORF Transcript_55057/g.99149 Transcript_55057/m.99149 type:complete len:247 (-) Transcript_55057:707-1447(-)
MDTDRDRGLPASSAPPDSTPPPASLLARCVNLSTSARADRRFSAATRLSSAASDSTRRWSSKPCSSKIACLRSAAAAWRSEEASCASRRAASSMATSCFAPAMSLAKASLCEASSACKHRRLAFVTCPRVDEVPRLGGSCCTRGWSRARRRIDFSAFSSSSSRSLFSSWSLPLASRTACKRFFSSEIWLSLLVRSASARLIASRASDASLRHFETSAIRTLNSLSEASQSAKTRRSALAMSSSSAA